MQELAKELEEEVHADRQRVEHMSRSHDQQLKELQQVPPLLCSVAASDVTLLCRQHLSARQSCCNGEALR